MNCINCTQSSNLEYTVLVCGESCANRPIATPEDPAIDAIVRNSEALPGSVISMDLVTDPYSEIPFIRSAILYGPNSEIARQARVAHVISIIILIDGTLLDINEYIFPSSSTGTNEQTDSEFDQSSVRSISTEPLPTDDEATDDEAVVVPDVLDNGLYAQSPFSEYGDSVYGDF